MRKDCSMETIIIIGAGASGMMAALTAAGVSGRKVILLERQQRAGRKLLATARTGTSPRRRLTLSHRRLCWTFSTASVL